jgi:hypothetical protein
VIRPKKDWPRAFRDFLEGRSEVDETILIREALLWPAMSPLDGAVVAWARSALSAMRWRQRKGSVWRRPARA